MEDKERKFPCMSCHRILPRTQRYFGIKTSNRLDGLDNACRVCRAERGRVNRGRLQETWTEEQWAQYREKNKIRARKLRARTREHINEVAMRRYYRKRYNLNEKVRGGDALFRDHGCVVQGLVTVR